MSGSWSNPTQTLIVVQADGTFTGLFIYSPTVGAGNLIASIAAAAGTDPYGNAYFEGINSYDPSNNRFSQLDGGLIRSGRTGDPLGRAAILSTATAGEPGILGITSQITAANPSPAILRLLSGVAGSVVGSASAPQLVITNNDTVTAVDLVVPGAVIGASTSGVPYTWQTPSFSGTWSGTTSFNGSAGFATAVQYRIDAEDNLWIFGGFVAGAAPATTVFNVPAPYRPAQTGIVAVQEADGGVIHNGFCTINSAGDFNVRTAAGFTLTAGATFMVNGKVPLRHLT